MSQIANTGTRGRTLLWLGIAVAIVAIAVFRVRLGTVLYLGFFLGLPFLMMRMHGGGHGGSSEQHDQTRDGGTAAGHQH